MTSILPEVYGFCREPFNALLVVDLLEGSEYSNDAAEGRADAVVILSSK